MGTFEKVVIGIAAGVCLVTMVLLPLGVVAFLGSLLAATQGQYLLAGVTTILGIGALVLWYLRKQKRVSPERQRATDPVHRDPQE